MAPIPSYLRLLVLFLGTPGSLSHSLLTINYLFLEEVQAESYHCALSPKDELLNQSEALFNV